MRVLLNIFLITILWFVALTHSAGTDCNARHMFQRYYSLSKKTLYEQKCAQIDVTSSYDSSGAELQFHWDLGDGNRAEGFRVKHCYEDYGIYKAVMRILSADGGIISPNELVVDIAIKEEVSLFMDVPDTIALESRFSPAWTISDQKSYKIRQVFFDFGDGNYSCGDDAAYKYIQPGFYNLRMLAILDAADGEFYLGTGKTIFVEGYNIDGQILSGYFQKYCDSNMPAYLDEPVRISIVDAKSHMALHSRVVLADERYWQQMPEALEAWLYVWKGNMLMMPARISRPADSSGYINRISEILGDQMKLPPLILSPLYFNRNKTRPEGINKRLYKDNIRILKSLPLATVAIGSYTYTGGMRRIAEKYARARSEALETGLRKYLGKKIDFQVDDPAEMKSLINTCFDEPGCGMENENLNGRSDLKIISIGKI